MKNFKATAWFGTPKRWEVNVVPLPPGELTAGMEPFEYKDSRGGDYGIWRSRKRPEPVNEWFPGIAEDYQEFLACLKEAGRGMKDRHYFRTHYAGSDHPKYRERLYCYELYHQLRMIMGDQLAYRLDGEMDKKGDPDFVGFEKIPDFIVHVPGCHTGNLVVVEVKKADVTTGELGADLTKLIDFISRPKRRYYRGIMLVYGDDGGEIPAPLLTTFSARPRGEERLSLIWHGGPGEEPVIIQAGPDSTIP